MENDVHIRKLSKQYCPQFGKIAVDMGFITEKQLKEAVAEQVEDGLSEISHRLIGSILYENGWITKEQIDIVVYEIFEREELIKWSSRSI